MDDKKDRYGDRYRETFRNLYSHGVYIKNNQ